MQSQHNRLRYFRVLVLSVLALAPRAAQPQTTPRLAASGIVISPSTLPNGTAGVAYSQTMTASGGTAPYAFSVTSGSLPAGLTLSTGGVLSGTPSTAGTSNFTMQATDSVLITEAVGIRPLATGSQVFSLTIAAAVPTLSQWAIILLAICLALAGLTSIRRRAATGA